MWIPSESLLGQGCHDHGQGRATGLAIIVVIGDGLGLARPRGGHDWVVLNFIAMGWRDCNMSMVVIGVFLFERGLPDRGDGQKIFTPSSSLSWSWLSAARQDMGKGTASGP